MWQCDFHTNQAQLSVLSPGWPGPEQSWAHNIVTTGLVQAEKQCALTEQALYHTTLNCVLAWPAWLHLTELTCEYEYPAGQAILSCYFDPALPSACYAWVCPVLAGRINVHYNVNITVMWDVIWCYLTNFSHPSWFFLPNNFLTSESENRSFCFLCVFVWFMNKQPTQPNPTA